MKSNNLIAACLMLSSPITAFAWGQKGHDTTVFIAENHLTPLTKATVEEILDGKSIVYYANWLDNASHTPEYAYSKTWHYKNIDADQSFDSAPLLDSGDIVRAVYSQVDVLKDPNSTKEDKALALKMVIHFLGDLHQPMHLGHASDLGGNRHTVKYFGRDNNLHSVWDSSLPESAHKWTYTEWQNQIDRVSQKQMDNIIANGTPELWAEETYKICKEVYDKTPEGTAISYDYIADWTPTIEEQFLKGGLRLADVLNTIFDPQYCPGNTFIK